MRLSLHLLKLCNTRCLTGSCALILGIAAVGAEEFSASDEVIRLERFAVTGTRTAQRVIDVPVRTELITQRELKPIQPRTVADAVEFVPGVRVENNCQNCNFSQIRLLGLEGAYSQILVNCQPIVSSLAAVYAVEQLPASLVERIEVVKGGGSALYGPGSIGGVINIIPRTPDETGGAFQFTVTDMKGHHVSGKSPGIGFSASLQGAAVSRAGHRVLSVYAQGDRELPVDLTGDGYTEVGLKELSSGGARYLHRLPAIGAGLTLEASATFENRRGGNNLDVIEHEADIAESIQSTRHTFGATWEQSLDPVHDYRVALSFVSTDRSSYYGSGRDPNAYGTTENPLFVFDSQVNHRLGGHLVSWGAQFTGEDLEDVQPAYSRQTDATYRNTGVYLQDEWTLSPRWEILAGVRGDHNNQVADDIVSPRLALRFVPTAALVCRVGYATGFRAPQVFDEDLHVTQVGGTGQIVKNDPTLSEESARTLTAGLQWQKRRRGLTWEAEANLFHTRIQDSFILEEDPGQSTASETVLVRRNGDGAKVYGAEFNLGVGRGETWSFQAGYVEQRSRYDAAIAPLDGTSSTRIQRTPDHYGTATLDTALPFAGLRLFVGAKFTGPMEVPHAAPNPADISTDYPHRYITENRIERSPSFLTWDCNVSREFELGTTKSGRHRHLTVRIGAKNVTDDRQKDFDQGEFRDSGYTYGPRLPRSWFVSAETNF